MTDKLVVTDNTHGVSKRQWKRWTEAGRLIFNDLYSTSINNQRIMTHPKTKIADGEWETIAWNHAWLAADYISMREKGTVKL